MTSTDPHAATLDAVLVLLQHGHLSVDDLVRHAEETDTTAITVADYITTKVMPTLSAGQRKTWGPYLKLLTSGYPGLCACTCDRCLDHFLGDSTWTPCPCVESGTCDCASIHWSNAAPVVDGCTTTFDHGYGDVAMARLSVTELQITAHWAETRSLKRVKVRARNCARVGRPTQRGDGRHAVEQLRSATSAMYGIAIDDDDLPGVHTNLGLKISKKKRPDVVQRSYSAEQVEQIWQAVFTSGGHDPELDMLIVWVMMELGARRGGPIGMRIGDLKLHTRAIRLSEKNDKVDDQPASPALIMTLLDHALRRGGNIVVLTTAGLDPADVTPLDVIEGRAKLNSDAPVLYYRPKLIADGFEPRPLTRKRFESLFNRLKRELPWLDELHGRPHDLRRTGATFIERAFGTAVAQRWLRHTVHTAVGTYVAAGDDEVRKAHEWWTGQSEAAS